MPTRTVATTQTNKLRALRAAARIGLSALDRGKFKEFRSIEDLQAYLNDLSDKIVSKRPYKSHTHQMRKITEPTKRVDISHGRG